MLVVDVSVGFLLSLVLFCCPEEELLLLLLLLADGLVISLSMLLFYGANALVGQYLKCAFGPVLSSSLRRRLRRFQLLIQFGSHR